MSCVVPLTNVAPSISEAAWKKALGVYKIVGKTGISEQIRKLEGVWKSVKTDDLDPNTVFQDCVNEKQFDDAKTQAARYLEQVQPKLISALTDFVKVLRAEIPGFKKAATFPKSAREYAEKMEKEASELLADCKKSMYDRFEKGFKKATDSMLMKFRMAGGKLAEFLQKGDAAIAKCRKEVAEATEDKDKLMAYDDFRAHYIRGVCALLPFFKKDPFLGKHLSDWLTLSSDKGTPTDASKLTPLLALLDKKLLALKADAEKAGIG